MLETQNAMNLAFSSMELKNKINGNEFKNTEALLHGEIILVGMAEVLVIQAAFVSRIDFKIKY